MSWRHHFIRALAIALVTGIALAASPAPAATPGEVKYGTSVFKKINEARANHDKVALKRSKCLQRFAIRQARRMANQRRIFHQELAPIWKKCGGTVVGENVAYSPAPPGSMVRMWMHSPDHKQNILYPFRLTGVAVRKAGGYWYASQVFSRK